MSAMPAGANGAAGSATSALSHTCAKASEKLVQLLERLVHPTLLPGGHGSVQSLLRRIELVQDQQRLVSVFFEAHRRDRTSAFTFLIGPDEARVRYHFEIPAEERHRLRAAVRHDQAVLAPG